MSEIEVVTFGCRLNAYESEVIRARAVEAGLKKAVIVNTCAVTSEAVRQSRQAIRKLKRDASRCAADRDGMRGPDRTRDVRRDARSRPRARQ